MKWIKETHGKTGSTENEQKEGEYKDKTLYEMDQKWNWHGVKKKK